MELRHRRYFVAVAEERHFTKAARGLRVAQPSVSRAIRVLEEGRAAGQLVTGLLYVDTTMQDFGTTERIPELPLKDLGENELRPTRDQFAQFMSEFA